MTALPRPPTRPHPSRAWLRRRRAGPPRRARLGARPRRRAAGGRDRRRARRRPRPRHGRHDRRPVPADRRRWSSCSSCGGRCCGPRERRLPTLPSSAQRGGGRRGRPAWKVWSGLWIVYIVWGSTYLAIRVMVETVPPLLGAGVRFSVAGAVMLAVLSFHRRGAARPARSSSARCWSGMLLPGANAVVTVAEQEVPSSLAALLIASVPLWVLADAPRRRASRSRARASAPCSSASRAWRCCSGPASSPARVRARRWPPACSPP